MVTLSLDVLDPPRKQEGLACVALVGNPNAGKTSLFNALTGLRAKTANFPGTTVERRRARLELGGRKIELVDLPGLYTLAAATDEERVARDVLVGAAPGSNKPSLAILILDATNLERNLFLASQVLELDVPVVAALNMTDLAHRAGIKVDLAALRRELGCPVVPIAAAKNHGIDALRNAVLEALQRTDPAPAKPEELAKACNCSGCPFESRYNWAQTVGSRCAHTPATHGQNTERIDRVLTHPVVGLAAFFTVMFAVFAMIFWIAQFPMGWIDSLFAFAQQVVAANVPEGDLQSLLVDGVIGGVGGMLIFLPQICILFFFLSLLEDTGYLARAAFVMDRMMQRVGLPGKAFLPMLSAHACAIPALMAARVIEDRRDRLVTMLVLPLMSCAARIPVYAMVTALLFADAPLKAAAAFTAAYLLGIVAAVLAAFALKGTILPGETRPLVLELPSYKVPSLRNALVLMLDRARIFVKKAGTAIFFLSILLWALATYPKSDPPPEAQQKITQAQRLEQAGNADEAAALLDEADRLTAQSALAQSFAGRIGRFIEPAIAPLGYDWQIGIGVVSSFAAREVIVSTLAIVYGVGESAADEDPQSLYDTLRSARRTDGSPVFDLSTCLSLLVFYVLAMQCVSTLVVANRETGSWRWPAFMFLYMTALAYAAAFVTYQTVLRL